jgi:hypothetical protein
MMMKKKTEDIGGEDRRKNPNGNLPPLHHPHHHLRVRNPDRENINLESLQGKVAKEKPHLQQVLLI